jgi:hypothetical protein
MQTKTYEIDGVTLRVSRRGRKYRADAFGEIRAFKVTNDDDGFAASVRLAIRGDVAAAERIVAGLREMIATWSLTSI